MIQHCAELCRKQLMQRHASLHSCYKLQMSNVFPSIFFTILRFSCACCHCRSQGHCRLYVLVHMFVEPLIIVFTFCVHCHVAAQKNVSCNWFFLFSHDFLPTHLSLVCLFVSATIYAHVLKWPHRVKKLIFFCSCC